MDGLVLFAQNVSDIQDANTALATSLGLVIVKKAGVAFFATRISTIVPTTNHAKMEPLASTPVKDLTLVPALQDGLEPTAKPGSPMNVLTICASMVEPVRY